MSDDDLTLRKLNEQAYDLTMLLSAVLADAEKNTWGSDELADCVEHDDREGFCVTHNATHYSSADDGGIPKEYVQAVNDLFEWSQDIHNHVEDSNPVWQHEDQDL